MKTNHLPAIFPANHSLSIDLWQPRSVIPAITMATSLLLVPQADGVRTKKVETKLSAQSQTRYCPPILGTQGSTLNSNISAAFQKLNAIRQLRPGWDTYDGEPPTTKGCDTVQAILETSQRYSLSVAYVTPTSDGSVLLKHEVGRTSMTWEIDGDGEIGLMIERIGDAPTFHSVSDVRIESFVSALAWNG